MLPTCNTISSLTDTVTFTTLLQNYTKYGFTKIRAPEHVFKLIKEFWDINRDKSKPENWPAGNTYTNHWTAPSTMVSVEDKSFKGGGFVLKQNIWNAARDTISEWTGQQLAECSLYGIRIYPTGAVLAPHVDRLPLVASAIINVDQDVDEPWPLEVIGHDGKAHNVTMVPGDLVLCKFSCPYVGCDNDFSFRSSLSSIRREPLSYSRSPISIEGTLHGKCLYPF
jgi:hypothetical protein